MAREIFIAFVFALIGFVPWLCEKRGMNIPAWLILCGGVVTIVAIAGLAGHAVVRQNEWGTNVQFIVIGLIALLAGIALTWWWIGPANQVTSDAKSEEITHDVALFLQFSDELADPVEIRQVNVPFWRALYSPGKYVHDKDKVLLFSIPPHRFIVMWFDKRAKYRQMLVKCVGSDSLKCAVHESNDRFAIIRVEGDVTRATLEVSVVPNK